MKRIDFSDKRLTTEQIQLFFKINPPISGLNYKYQTLEAYGHYESLFVDGMKYLNEKHHPFLKMNFIVNLVSIMEVHFKELIRLNAAKWRKDHYGELLTLPTKVCKCWITTK